MVVRLVIEYTKLTRGNAMNGGVGVDDELVVGQWLQSGMVELWGVADFEGDLRIGLEGMGAGHEAMEILEHKLLLVGGLRVIAFADV